MSFAALARESTPQRCVAGLRVSKPSDSSEQDANRVASEVIAGGLKRHWSFSTVNGAGNPVLARHADGADSPPRIERNVDVPAHVIPMDAPAVPEKERKCEVFPGGSTDCEVDATTGTPTGKVSYRVDETNPCTRACVEQHEEVHVKQLKTFCPKLGDCYKAADKGKRPVTDCVKMAMWGGDARECSAYRVSVPCMEKRLASAKECQSNENKAYGTRKLASEKCWRDHYCGAEK
jgi:hypothetical protein